MPKICLTAGTGLTEILWAATALPMIRRAFPEAVLAWECPLPDFKKMLESYPELNEVVGDVEAMAIPPDIYVILHPFWHPVETVIDSPLQAIMKLISPWCAIPEVPPERPYFPYIPTERPHLADLPSNYICIDPQLGPNLPLTSIAEQSWVILISYLALPAVQVGSKDIPLLTGMIDGRGAAPDELAKIMAQAQLFIGADSDSSCLAGALQKPQIWFEFKDSIWWWPRGTPPSCMLYQTDSIESWNLSELINLIWNKLNAGGSENES